MNVFSAVYIFLIHLCFCPLGCSYLFEVQNEVHNNSSLEIYYQVHLHANGMTFGGWGDRRQGRDTKSPSPPLFFYSIGGFCPKKSCFKCKRDASLLQFDTFLFQFVLGGFLTSLHPRSAHICAFCDLTKWTVMEQRVAF